MAPSASKSKRRKPAPTNPESQVPGPQGPDAGATPEKPAEPAEPPKSKYYGPHTEAEIVYLTRTMGPDSDDELGGGWLWRLFGIRPAANWLAWKISLVIFALFVGGLLAFLASYVVYLVSVFLCRALPGPEYNRSRQEALFAVIFILSVVVTTMIIQLVEVPWYIALAMLFGVTYASLEQLILVQESFVREYFALPEAERPRVEIKVGDRTLEIRRYFLLDWLIECKVQRPTIRSRPPVEEEEPPDDEETNPDLQAAPRLFS